MNPTPFARHSAAVVADRMANTSFASVSHASRTVALPRIASANCDAIRFA